MKAILIAMTMLVAGAAPAAQASTPVNIRLALADTEASMTIRIELSPDGRDYVIDSALPLDVGGAICSHLEGRDNELACRANRVASFEVSTGSGDDDVSIGKLVPVPTTLSGGPGNDTLAGGSSGDKLVGGVGDDVLVGRAGADSLFGGPGDDRLVGGSGNDLLHGDGGRDTLLGGSGQNELVP